MTLTPVAISQPYKSSQAGLTCVVFALVSMWKENRFGWPLRGIIWFTVAIAGSCAIIALLAGYVQKTKSLEKVTRRVEVAGAG